MLRYLHIRSIAVIDELEVEFGPGLNVISGETGSGKSLLIGSISLLTGGRASAELLRSGADKALVEGIFVLDPGNPVWPLLAEQGIEAEDGELIVRREITASGGGRIHVNGVLLNATALRQIGPCLAEIHGQQDTRLMLQPRYHLDLLDLHHGETALLDEVARFSREIRAARAELAELERDEHARLQRLDMLEFQAREIDEAGLSDGEEEALLEERLILANAEKLFQVSSEAYESLYEREEAILTLLARHGARIEDAARLDPRLLPVSEAISNSRYGLEDAARLLRDHAASLEVNEGRLDEIEGRLAQIGRFRRKYAPTVAEILIYRSQVEEELLRLRGSDERKVALEKRQETLVESWEKSASRLGRVRRKSAEFVARGVTTHLADLSMGGTRFSVEFFGLEPGHGCPGTGLETAEFYVSPNIGEELRPLRKTASGGELSRLALSLKLELRSGGESCMVFDEVDAGVGGGTAEKVGLKLREASRLSQAFCITHVPQIAALADRHYRVEKHVKAGKTFATILPLDVEARVEELARMLGGVHITDITRQHARQLLEAAVPATS